jgi:hypothetical protein
VFNIIFNKGFKRDFLHLLQYLPLFYNKEILFYNKKLWRLATYVMPSIVTRLPNQSLGIRKLAQGPIGENNEYVLKSILRITDSEIEQNAAEGAFY